MKTIFTLLLSLVTTVSLMAADVRPRNTLMIRSANRADIRVVIDGRRFEPNDNSMMIRGISSGFHTIKVYREKNVGRYSIFGKRYEVVFNKSIRLKNNATTAILIDRFGRATVRESRPGGGGWGRDDRDFRDNRDSRDDRDFRDQDFGKDDDDIFNDSDWNKSKDFDFDSGHNSGDYGFNDVDDNYGYDSYKKSMSEVDFSRVLESMQKEWLETNKQKSASHIISTNYLTTSQVKRMLQLFSFESIKLDLAKQAYAKTIDKNNYVIINDVFSFSSSKDELARFIRSSR